MTLHLHCINALYFSLYICGLSHLLQLRCPQTPEDHRKEPKLTAQAIGLNRIWPSQSADFIVKWAASQLLMDSNRQQLYANAVKLTKRLHSGNSARLGIDQPQLSRRSMTGNVLIPTIVPKLECFEMVSKNRNGGKRVLVQTGLTGLKDHISIVGYQTKKIWFSFQYTIGILWCV